RSESIGKITKLFLRRSLVSPWSVGVFSFLSLKLRVIFIIVNWASLNAQEAFLYFLLGRTKIIAWPIEKQG
ncbi:MAG TPA: hypothetical protein P5552_10640, partial [Candidatus Competibacteraceae bacterium]|nr:hypothetical protein [Candidatus Competibacteraceae bacterium]